jgi:hypothetical protein
MKRFFYISYFSRNLTFLHIKAMQACSFKIDQSKDYTSKHGNKVFRYGVAEAFVNSACYGT